MSRVSGCLPTQIPDSTANGLTLMADSSGNVSWQFPLGVAAPTAPAASGSLLVSTGSGTAAWQPAVAPVVTTLTFAAGTVAVNAALGNEFVLTLTASTATLGNPTNPVDGQTIRVRVIQGGAGSFTLAYGSAYDFGTAGAPTLTTAAGKVDILIFEYVASLPKWCCIDTALGF